MIPKLSIKLKEKFGHIGYVDVPHKYYDLNTRKELISVTTLIKKYQPKFDEDYWAEYKAKEYGITKEEVLKYWELLRNKGTGKGSIVHDHLENRWWGKVYEIDYRKYIPPLGTTDLIKFDKRQEKLIIMANQFVKDHKNIVPIRTELIVGNNKVAGQVDFFGYNLDTKKFIVLDWKTDKAINYGNDFQVFKSPIMHLDDCNINKYSLQIKMYQELLKQAIPEEKESYIVWFNADNDTYKKIQLKDLTNEARLLLANC
jgi:hypothetical protein